MGGGFHGDLTPSNDLIPDFPQEKISRLMEGFGEFALRVPFGVGSKALANVGTGLTSSLGVSSGIREQVSIRLFRVYCPGGWRDPPFSRNPSTLLNISDWNHLDGGGTLWHATGLPYNCYSAINPQVLRLTCTKPWELPETYNAQLAIQRMEAYSFVGIVEAYQPSLCILMAKVGDIPLPAYCNCEGDRWDEFEDHFPTVNEGPKVKKSIDNFSDDIQEILDSLTQEDLVLYKAAWKRFLREADHVEKTFGVKVFCQDKVKIPTEVKSVFEAFVP